MHTIYKYLLGTILLLSIHTITFGQVVYISEDALEEHISYANSLCQYIEKDIQADKTLDRKRLRHLTSNGVLVKWFQAEGYNFSSGALDYLQMKLQYETFKSCHLYRNRFHYIFDNKNVKNDSLVQQHQEMITFMNAFENRADLSSFCAEEDIIENISTTQKIINNISEAVFFEIKYMDYNSSYAINYYLFTPESEIRYPMDSKNRVLKMTFAMVDDKVQTFEQEIKEANYKRIKQDGMQKELPPPPPAPEPEPIRKN